MLVVRIQTRDGVKKFEVGENDTLKSLHGMLFSNIKADFGECHLYKSRKMQQVVPRSDQTVTSFGIENGQMLCLKEPQKKLQSENIYKKVVQKFNIEEDKVDQELWKDDGRILGNDCNTTIFKVENLALEPWDTTYLKENGIKFLSFHSFMREQLSRDKYFKLENQKVALPKIAGRKTNFNNLPATMTLCRQKFRFVDNIVFENKDIVDSFLNFWSKSGGAQRMAFLYGTYTKFEHFPLGIKAEIKAIYEPTQKNDKDSYKLIKDPNLKTADKIAKKIGLQRVGWIFTDLDALEEGKFEYKRNSSSYFLSAKECIRAGYYQTQHPNYCRHASTESFGSKFVTVVASGNEENEISFKGYQISTQGMALVADRCLSQKNATPEFGYIEKSTPERYVSDVYYKKKDEYGNIVNQSADKFPIGYIITEVKQTIL